MALPSIQPYELPTARELPEPRVHWRAVRKRAALLIHDMQGYFVGAFPKGEAPIAPAIANIAALRDHCAWLGIPIVYTAQPGRQPPEERGLQRHFWGAGMTTAADERAIVTELAPAPGDLLLEKWRYSAFQRSELETVLRERGRDQLLITGVFAHIGCLLTAAEAFMRDVEPFLVADAIADFSRELHDHALCYAAGCCAVPVTVASLLETL